MNHKQQSSDGKHDDDAALSDFLASLMDYTPTVSLLCFFFFFFSLENLKKFTFSCKIQSKAFSGAYCFVLNFTFRYQTSWWSITQPRAGFNVPMFDCRYFLFISFIFSNRDGELKRKNLRFYIIFYVVQVLSNFEDLIIL